MQILLQGFDNGIDAVSPIVKPGPVATTSSKNDNSFQGLLRSNQGINDKAEDQPGKQYKKAGASTSPRDDSQPYGQPDMKMAGKNKTNKTTSSSMISKDTKTAKKDDEDITAPQGKNDANNVAKGQDKDDKNDSDDADAARALLTFIAIGPEGITGVKSRMLDQVHGGGESDMTEIASTKNGYTPTDLYPPSTYTQDNTPPGLPSMLQLTPQETQQSMVQTPANDLTDQRISQEIKISADESSTEALMKKDLDIMQSISDKTSLNTALIHGEDEKQIQQPLQPQASQAPLISLGTATSNKSSTHQTDMSDGTSANSAGIMGNQGIDKANKVEANPAATIFSSTSTNKVVSHRQLWGQTNLQTDQTDNTQGAADAADIATQLLQGPENQKAAKRPQNIKDPAVMDQSMDVRPDNKIISAKIASDNRQDSAGIDTGSENSERTAGIQKDPKITKAEDQTPGQFVLGVTNNATDKASNNMKFTRTDLIDKKDLVQGIKDQAFSNLSIGDKRVVLHLDPPDLGKVRVDITLTSNNELRATFTADHPDVRNIIQGQLDGLKGHLDQKGFNVTQLKVDGGVQTGFTSLDHRGQGNPENWTNANDVITQPVSKNNMGQDMNDTTYNLTQDAFIPWNRVQNGRVNLII